MSFRSVCDYERLYGDATHRRWVVAPRPRRRVLRAHSDEDGSLGERWITKRELAHHLSVSARFIEMQQRLGLPMLRIGATNRYRTSEVEAWLRTDRGCPDAAGRP